MHVGLCSIKQDSAFLIKHIRLSQWNHCKRNLHWSFVCLFHYHFYLKQHGNMFPVFLMMSPACGSVFTSRFCWVNHNKIQSHFNYHHHSAMPVKDRFLSDDPVLLFLEQILPLKVTKLKGAPASASSMLMIPINVCWPETPHPNIITSTAITLSGYSPSTVFHMMEIKPET